MSADGFYSPGAKLWEAILRWAAEKPCEGEPAGCTPCKARKLLAGLGLGRDGEHAEVRCRECRRSLPKHEYDDPNMPLHPGICLSCEHRQLCAVGKHAWSTTPIAVCIFCGVAGRDAGGRS